MLTSRPVLLSLSLLFPLLTGCAFQERGVEPQKSQLQIREFQTRTFQVKNHRQVLKAVLNVLQDDGYIVKNANTELGLLTATKEVDVESKGDRFFSEVFLGREARWEKNKTIECSINVSEFGTETKVRANFVMKVLDNRGGTLEIRNVEDQKFYQEFFTKVDKGIFIQKEKL